MHNLDIIRSLPATARPVGIFYYLDHALTGDDENLVWNQDFINKTISVKDLRTNKILSKVTIEEQDTWGDIEKKVKDKLGSKK